ncbi:glycosyltransferase [Vibrio tubiashii]|uniref:glycosyltransferase n=1 Tax=Vibrio tubiashii TaxID=29498 RepID=UPI00234ECD1C|nr:glycosyltransferase [Vibrio tubiashii]WCP67293.1 glycosyltransferase [Vibrio tubiashii]
MIKVAFLITKSEVGGAQSWMEQLTKLLEKDIDPIIITNQPGWLSTVLPNSLFYFVPEIERRVSLVALVKISHILSLHRVETVVASSANAGLYARILSLRQSYKCVYVSHGWSCIYNGGKLKWIYSAVEFLLSMASDVVWCISSSDYLKAKNIIKVPESKLRVAPNAVFPLKVNSSKDLIDAKTLRLVCVARLCPPKRFDLLIDAVSRLSDVDLTIVGGGSEYREMVSRTQSPNICFLGEVAAFRDYAQFDAFILLSDSEGLPMSAIEAGSARLPMILSNVGGCGELVNLDYPNGILVNNNEESVCNAVLDLKNRFSLYKLGAEAMVDKFDIRMYKSAYLSILR